MRPVLIEKIRQTIEKSREADNMCQYRMRMNELNSLPQYFPKPKKINAKPKAYTQFSKMLIFINFHKPDEEKRWIHQDYMDSLKRGESDTPKSYGVPKKKLIEKQS